jgi:hypothetical protein
MRKAIASVPIITSMNKFLYLSGFMEPMLHPFFSGRCGVINDIDQNLGFVCIPLQKTG